MKRTLLVMAGGTGGHVMPGLAVAEAMRGRDWNVVWLGHPEGMEAELVARHGITLQPLRFGGLRGKGWRARLSLPWTLLRACWQACRTLRAVRPAVVLGMGGYVAFPGGVMAALLRLPLVVHEQNSVAGLTNAVLARMADRVLEAFPGALRGAQWSGNPVRADFAALPPPAQRYAARTGPLRVLVVGGSLGAQAINTVVPQALARLPEALRPQVVHQAGRRHAAFLEQAYQAAGVTAQVVPFIDDMAAALAEADVVIGRAGAMTVAEIAAAGVASVLVPFPYAVDDHQTHNARFLTAQRAALCVAQPELTPERLAGLLGSLQRAELAAMAERAHALARPDATRCVADVCEEVARQAEQA